MIGQTNRQTNRDYSNFLYRELYFRLAEELDETKKRFNETLVMTETIKDTSKHKNKTISEEEEEEEEENLRDKLIKAEEDVKVQGYPQRIRLQRPLYAMEILHFLLA